MTDPAAAGPNGSLEERIAALERRLDARERGLAEALDALAVELEIDDALRSARAEHVAGLRARIEALGGSPGDVPAAPAAPSGSPRLVLHPGNGKCGSSSLQAFLYRNRQALEALGVWLPDPRFRFAFEPPFRRRFRPARWEPGIPGWYLNEAGPAALEARVDEVRARAEAEGASVLMVSSEFLHRPDHPLHALLADRFERVDVVYYVRRQDELLESAWEQWDHRRGDSPGESATRRLRAMKPRFLETAVGFEEVFGAGRVRVKPFGLGRAWFTDEHIGLDLLDEVGIPRNGLPADPTPSNPGLNHHLCDYLRRMAYQYGDGEHGPAHDNWLKRAFHGRARSGVSKRRRSVLTHAQRNRILDLFEEENRLLHDRYFPATPFDDVFARLPEGPSAEYAALAKQLEKTDDALLACLEIVVQGMRRDREAGGSLAGRLRRAGRALLGRG